MPKVSRMNGPKILDYVKSAYKQGKSNSEVAEELSQLTKEYPADYGYGDSKKWDAGKVSYFAVKHGIGKGKPGSQKPKVAPKRTWTRRATAAPVFRDIEIPTAPPRNISEAYILVLVPQSKLNTIMEVLK